MPNSTCCKAWNSEPGKLPLVLGVTGHRDLRAEDIAPLEEVVRAIFDGLRHLCPNTPLVVVSALAEGADRLVARIGLEFHARLIAPLPLPMHLYTTDFPGSLTEFDELLGKSDWFELPIFGGFNVSQIASLGSERDEQYANVGAYIVRHSHILLALWDGLRTDQTGGTSEVVDWRLNGVPARHVPHGVYSHIGGPEQGFVYHIKTPRRKNPTVDEPFKVALLSSYGGLNADLALALREHNLKLKLLDRFNQDVADFAPRLDWQITVNSEYAYPEETCGSLSPSLHALRMHYGVADTLALHFQSETYRVLNGLHCLAFAALLCFEIYSHAIPGHPWWALLLFPAFLGGALAWNALARLESFESKYLDYRALAEGLRIALFWRLGGVDSSVPDHYLRIQRGELRWIPDAIRGLEAVIYRPGKEVSDDAETVRLDAVLTHWVRDQHTFFAGRAPLNERKKDLFDASSRIGLSRLSAAVVVLVGSASNPGFDADWLLSPIPIGLVSAALLHTYSEKRAFAAHARQYALMADLFGKAEQRLSSLKSDQLRATTHVLSDGRAVLGELGREALVENGEWLLLHRERPVEVPL